MASIFSKNGILTGRIDYYCLVCAEQFTNEDETLVHIANTQHKEDLKACGYFEKYKENFIRKTNGIYFCEPCSLTFPTATKVELHIDEPSHITAKNRISPWLKRVEKDIIVFNQFIVSDDAWNGCVEDTCVLCNTEFDDSSSHKAIRSHVLNLMKSEVNFDEVEKTVYRTIDTRSQQCLTCNVIFGTEPASHFKTVEHKDAYKLYVPSIQKNDTETTTTSKNTDTKKESQNVKGGNGENNKEKELKDISIEHSVFNGNVNGDITKAAGKKSDKDTKTAATKTLEKEKVTQKSKQSVKKENAEELDKIYCKNLGANNYITDVGETKWCILCEWLLEGSAQAHIRTKHHQTLLKLHKERLAENNNISSKDEGTIPYESVDRYQKNNVNIDFINETAFCKKCSRNIDFNTDAIEKHIEEHKKTCNIKEKSPETLSSGIKSNGTEKTTLYTKPVLLGKDKRQKTVSVGDYAKQHGFTHNRADVSYYCHPCTRRLSATLEDLQKHVASRIHTENTKSIAKIDKNEAPVKEPLLKYIESFELVDTKDDGCVIVINNKFWLNAFGFFLIAKKVETIFCHGCHIDLTSENVVEHIILRDNHREMVEKCLVITSLQDEFIREIKLDVYHCGYCNLTQNDWDDVLDHIATSEHKREKSKAEKSLREHRPNDFYRPNLRDIDDMIKHFAVRNGM